MNRWSLCKGILNYIHILSRELMLRRLLGVDGVCFETLNVDVFLTQLQFSPLHKRSTMYAIEHPGGSRVDQLNVTHSISPYVPRLLIDRKRYFIEVNC